MKRLITAAAACAAMLAWAKPVAVTTETGARMFVDSADLAVVGSASPDLCAAVAPRVEVLWADYTNRAERARIRKERMDAARRARGENVQGQPPVKPWRAVKAGALRVPASRKGAVK